MDANSSRPNDLNKLEQRLAAWEPASAGLDPEAMLSAAGRASARGVKAWLAWPILSGCLALAVLALGAWLAAERADRLRLLAELSHRPVETAPVSTPVPDETPTTEALAPDGYLALRREWELHPDDALRPAAPGQAPKRPASPEPSILRAWQPDGPPPI